MRVAALYDIHGNLPALEAVLDETRRAQVDRVVVGGDVVPGPMQRTALALLNQLEVPVQFIRGNCEVAVLAQRAGTEQTSLPEQVRETIRWSANDLDSNAARRMASWPRTLRLDVPGLGAVLFCHGTPRDENEIFTRLTPEDLLRPVFDDLGVGLVVCGHTHMQFDRMIGATRVVNAGSVGMPFGQPGADWLLLDRDVQLRRTPYDLSIGASRIRETSYPQAEEFAARYVLQPPTEQAMLEAFTHASFK
jgi:putative phosphoesterase